jgi:hypothetical protein
MRAIDDDDLAIGVRIGDPELGAFWIHETTTLGSDTLLMIQRFREANPDKGDRQLSAAELLRKNAHRIRGIGPLLEMAGLAEQDAQSALGWRPTQHLVNLIAERPVADQ